MKIVLFGPGTLFLENKSSSLNDATLAYELAKFDSLLMLGGAAMTEYLSLTQDAKVQEKVER